MLKNEFNMSLSKLFRYVITNACELKYIIKQSALGVFLLSAILFNVVEAKLLKGPQNCKNAFLLNKHRLSPNSLNHFASWKYSQFGEDGIIEEIFRRLNINKGFFVEFGGCDGIYLSNTRKLYEKGWDGAYIEQDIKWFNKLRKNYKTAPNILCLHNFVHWNEKSPKGMTFDAIKAKHFPNREIDFLSIDIDGCDYYILKSLKCRPKVICIENNLFWHPLYDKEVPQGIAQKNINQPLQVVINKAKEMGYEPVCATINLFLVRRDLYEPFQAVPNDTLTIWRDAFRTFGHKQYTLNMRKTHSYFMDYEGQALNDRHPLTLDY